MSLKVTLQESKPQAIRVINVNTKAEMYIRIRKVSDGQARVYLDGDQQEFAIDRVPVSSLNLDERGNVLSCDHIRIGKKKVSNEVS